MLTKYHLKELTKLKQKKYRELAGEVIIEGKRLISQVIDYGIIPEELFLLKSHQNLVPDFPAEIHHLVSIRELSRLTSTKNPQPIAAKIKLVEKKISDDSFLLYLDGIREPGNLGTIIRTATAAGVTGIVLSPDCCEHYNPKVIRASLGSVFFMPLEIQEIDWLKKRNSVIISTAMNAETSLFEYKAPLPKKMILVVGSEAFGISKEILEISDIKLKIPISPNIESLNAAAAAAIAMFQLKK